MVTSHGQDGGDEREAKRSPCIIGLIGVRIMLECMGLKAVWTSAAQ